MKKALIGAGIFTLVFSLSLFIWGSSEGKLTPSSDSLFTQNSLNPNLLISDCLDLQYDGLHQRQLETRKVHEVTIKFPFPNDGQFFLYGPNKAQKSNKQLTKNSSFFSSSDLPVKYCNLRI